MNVFLSILGIACLIVIYAIFIYNKLVAKKNLSEEGYSGIDVQLKRRYDLIPNLIETVKGYAAHESKTLENVTEWRARAQGATNTHDRFQAEAALSKALLNVFAVSENYPALQANANFIELQSQLTQIEEQIQFARRYYNGTVRDFNTLIQMFPSNIIAQYFGFGVKPFFEIENAAERETPKVSFAS